MKAVWNNTVIAESNDIVLVEGNHYFPEASLKKEFTTNSHHKSMCPLERPGQLLQPDGERRNEHRCRVVLR
jgi:Domain of unknown function (DUF427)